MTPASRDTIDKDMPRNEEIFPLLRKAVEQAAARTAPKAAINKDETLAHIVRRWFQKQKGSPDEIAKTRTRIKDLTSKSERTQETGREGLKGELFLTQQPEFKTHLTNTVMEKVLDKVPQPLPTWMPPRAELNDNPFLAEAAARIALLPDHEDPAALYEQLTIMYRSGNFSKMTDGEIRQFRNFVDKTKGEIIRLATVYPEKKFSVTTNDDIESPWRKKADIYRSRRLSEPEANPTNDVAITSKNKRRELFDAFLKDMQEQLEVEDPKKEGKALIELRKRIESHKTPDNSRSTTKMVGRRNEDVFNESEAQEYIGIINKRLETIGSEERWVPIMEEAPGAVSSIDRVKLLEQFQVDPDIIAKLIPDVRAYYEKIKDFLRVAPSRDINQVTINGFLRQMEMLSRAPAGAGGRTPESDAAIQQLFEVIQSRMKSGELKIPTSIYLDVDEVRAIMDDFPGWAEKYMRKIELLIAERGTDDPALRPAMDRFNLAQEFYGGEFFDKNLVSPDLPPEDAARLKAFFEKTYKDRVYVMDQYRVRLAHAELENQLEFVRDWDSKSPDVQRVVEIAKRLGDQGIFAMRGYHGGMVDVVASNYLLPIMSEKVFPSDTPTPKRVRWTKELFREVREDTKKRFKRDVPAYNEQYKKHMMDLRWRAKGSAYVDADQIVEDRIRTSGAYLTPEQHEIMKRIEFEKIVNDKIKRGEIKYASLDDADSDETIESIVRTAISSARLQFQVEEKVVLSQRARFADMETGYSAFVFAGWEERFMRANYYFTDHKYRWGVEPHEGAMWRQGNEYLMKVNPELRSYARRESAHEWDSFNNWWDDFHRGLPAHTEWSDISARLTAYKERGNPTEKALYDQYVHFVQQFYGYPHHIDIGSPIGPDKQDTYQFFHDLKTDKLKGKNKFRRQVESSLVTTWQEDHLTRSYNYWKSGERTKAYRKELTKALGGNVDNDKYYFRGQTLFKKAREYFMPDQKIETAHTREELIKEINGYRKGDGTWVTGQAGFHPLQFIQLEQRVEGIAGLNEVDFDEAQKRFHMIQGVVIANAMYTPLLNAPADAIREYRPIDYLTPTDDNRKIVHDVFEKIHGPDFPMTEQRYLEYMRDQALHVQQKVNSDMSYTDFKYAELLGREILYYDDQPQAIINPEQTVTASKGASNLYARSLYDHILGLKAADLQDSLMTLDLKVLDQGSEELRILIRNYNGEQDGAVAKALALARYAGYTRGHIDLADAVLRGKTLTSEAQEIGKYPGAPANSAIELEQILGQAQKTERLENLSPAFGEALESFSGLSSYTKITGGENGWLAKVLGPRKYREAIRFLNDKIPSHVTLIRFRNTALFFGLTVGLFIAKEAESGGEERKRG